MRLRDEILLMKTTQLILTSVTAAGLAGLAACQNAASPAAPRKNNFDRQTSQTLNPVSRQYEQQPPFGPRGNKAEEN